MNLTLTNDEICHTASSLTTDTQAVADAQFILDHEQASVEATLDPTAFANQGAEVAALVRRSVVKLLAAEVLQMRGRADGASGTFVGAGITLANAPDHAAALRSEARAALAPYLRKGAVGAASVVGVRGQ